MSNLYLDHLEHLKRDRCIIFGPIYNDGHFAYSKSSGSHRLRSGFGDWISSLDGTFPPQFNGQTEGEALLHQFDGFCVLAFWARCFDKRPGSNIAFVIHGNHDFETACKIASEVFGGIWSEFPFRVAEWNP